MKKDILIIFSLSLLLSLPIAAEIKNAKSDKDGGKIYLYGEEHGVEKITQKELELFRAHYKRGCTHLFLEIPSYTAEFLNLWMKEKDDTILDALFKDLEGTAFCNPHTLSFFREIKKYFPRTVFHGTDVGHQYETTGKRFLLYLESEKRQGEETWTRTKETVRQGEIYYTDTNQNSMAYREKMMVQNFVYEFQKLHGEDVVGIYGSAHTDVFAMDTTGTQPCMARALKALYGEALRSENLALLVKEISPLRSETVTAAGKRYKAFYYGKQDLRGFRGFAFREFYRLSGAYKAMEGKKKTGDYLPQSNYPMKIKEGEVYVIDYTKIDGTAMRLYYICSGKMLKGEMISENIAPE